MFSYSPCVMLFGLRRPGVLSGERMGSGEVVYLDECNLPGTFPFHGAVREMHTGFEGSFESCRSTGN